jgi:hypothetical protein
LSRGQCNAVISWNFAFFYQSNPCHNRIFAKRKCTAIMLFQKRPFG